MVETYPAQLKPGGVYEYPINIEASAYPITLQWKIVDKIDGYSIVISTPDGKIGQQIIEGSGLRRIEGTNLKSIYVSLMTGAGSPKEFALLQNYPNPFNPLTVIRYQLPVSGHVRLTMYDVLGREVVSLVNESKAPGTYDISWDASNYPSGVYFYRLRAGKFSDVKKLILIK